MLGIIASGTDTEETSDFAFVDNFDFCASSEMTEVQDEMEMLQMRISST